MSVKISCDNKIVTAYISGDIDHHLARDIRERIDVSVESYRPDLLIMDFKDVAFMDSSGIGLVMGRYKIMQELGGAVQVTNTSGYINKVMRLAGLDRLGVIKSSPAAR